MLGRILIADDIATNRIVLKVKLSAAYYDVAQATSGAEALAVIARDPPDLVLVSNRLPDMTGSALCAALRENAETACLPVMILSTEYTKDARLAALAAGADDILQKPVNDLLLLARLRSLLRARASNEEMRLREGTNRVLGLAEDQRDFERPAEVVLITPEPALAHKWKAALHSRCTHQLTGTCLKNALPHLNNHDSPDTIVIALGRGTSEQALRLMADVRARSNTRHVPVLLVLAEEEKWIASDALDFGANDLMSEGFSPEEMVLRLDKLIRQNRVADRLRNSLRDGLKASVIDPLTGLFNRRYAMPHLKRMADAARINQRNFAVMVADLDHFKRVNDQYEHAAGDAVLVSVARQIGENLRTVDLAARIGGEEFLVAMPDTNKRAAEQAAKRLCDLIARTPVHLPNGAGEIHVTISIGVAIGSGLAEMHSLDVEGLIDVADQALYRAKSDGRNQVTLSDRPAA